MKIKRFFFKWLCAWIDLATAFVSVVTFGLVWTWWDMKIRAWSVLRKKTKPTLTKG